MDQAERGTSVNISLPYLIRSLVLQSWCFFENLPSVRQIAVIFRPNWLMSQDLLYVIADLSRNYALC